VDLEQMSLEYLFRFTLIAAHIYSGLIYSNIWLSPV